MSQFQLVGFNAGNGSYSEALKDGAIYRTGSCLDTTENFSGLYDLSEIDCLFSNVSGNDDLVLGFETDHGFVSIGQLVAYDQHFQSDRPYGDVADLVETFFNDLVWFSGNFLEFQIPRGAVDAIAQSGDNLPAVQDWIDTIATYNLSNKQITNELDQFGAWDENELKNRADNLERLIWTACHDISERGDEDEENDQQELIDQAIAASGIDPLHFDFTYCAGTNTIRNAKNMMLLNKIESANMWIADMDSAIPYQIAAPVFELLHRSHSFKWSLTPTEKIEQITHHVLKTMFAIDNGTELVKDFRK